VPDTLYNPLARGSPAPPGVGMVNAWQEGRIGIENRYSRSQSAISRRALTPWIVGASNGFGGPQSTAGCEEDGCLHLLAPVADFQAELPAFEAHEHAPHLVP
jgi:hypothetical protein